MFQIKCTFIFSEFKSQDKSSKNLFFRWKFIILKRWISNCCKENFTFKIATSNLEEDGFRKKETQTLWEYLFEASSEA